MFRTGFRLRGADDGITWPKLNNSLRIIHPVDLLVRKTVFSAELYHSCFS